MCDCHTSLLHTLPPHIRIEQALSNCQYSLGKHVTADRSFCVSDKVIMEMMRTWIWAAQYIIC